MAKTDITFTDDAIKNLVGNPMMFDKGVELTIKIAVAHALTTPLDDERTLSYDQKLKNGKLAERIMASEDKPVSLSNSEFNTIKERCGKFWDGLVVLQLDPYLEGEKVGAGGGATASALPPEEQET